METFIGHIKTPQDALIIFEACRRGLLNRVKRRLSNKERMNIKSGSIFAFDENEAGMRRWTDGRTWSPSRVLGSFLTYRELDTKRRPRKLSTSASSVGGKMNSQHMQQQQQQCIYKPNGLIKQSFSICTATNQKIHLISYYSKSDVLNGRLTLPSQDPHLSKIGIPKGLYPELNPLDTSGGHSATLHLLMNSNQQQRQHQHQSFNHNEQEEQEEEEEENSNADENHPHSSTSSTSSARYHYTSRYHQPPSLSSSPMSTCSDDDILSPSHTTMSFSSSSSHQHPSQPSSQHKKYHHQHNPPTSGMISSTTSPKLPTPLSPHYHHHPHQQHHQPSLLPPVQVWKPYPLQPEDTRQLEALKTQLRI
ncbi:Gti1/Pac2 family-domain-containing protein [Cunninghamella echinulata]|nr:Gti1/Pac2 family-domain-containing protein [Cunninghamella echinulata]